MAKATRTKVMKTKEAGDIKVAKKTTITRTEDPDSTTTTMTSPDNNKWYHSDNLRK